MLASAKALKYNSDSRLTAPFLEQINIYLLISVIYADSADRCGVSTASLAAGPRPLLSRRQNRDRIARALAPEKTRRFGPRPRKTARTKALSTKIQNFTAYFICRIVRPSLGHWMQHRMLR